MGYHTFDVGRADQLEDAAARYRYLSAEELLWSVAPSADDVVADLGSGTGFYTDDLAPHVEQVYAIDVQEAMHEYYRGKGVPDNVALVTAEVADLPLADGRLDAAASTMTYYEFAGSAALAELSRVLRSDGRLAIADWSADGPGAAGPPVAERFTAEEAATALREQGFDVEHVAVRPETFLLVASND